MGDPRLKNLFMDSAYRPRIELCINISIFHNIALFKMGPMRREGRKLQDDNIHLWPECVKATLPFYCKNKTNPNFKMFKYK